jgi:hypothetical protein
VKLTIRSALILLLAIQFVGLQWFGALHRTLHAPLSAGAHFATHTNAKSHSHKTLEHEITDNVDNVDSARTSVRDGSLAEAWSDHKNKTDCDRFDACTSGDGLSTASLSLQFIPPSTRVTTRSYVANIFASTRIALARAPPFA